MKRLRLAIIAGLLTTASVAIAAEPVTFFPIYSETVTYSGTPGLTAQAVTNSQTRVRLVCDSDCFVAVSQGSTTAATSSPVYLPNGVPEYFIVKAGSQIMVIQDSASGSLYVTHMSR